jgi:hypothetical protein
MFAAFRFLLQLIITRALPYSRLTKHRSAIGAPRESPKRNRIRVVENAGSGVDRCTAIAVVSSVEF